MAPRIALSLLLAAVVTLAFWALARAWLDRSARRIVRRFGVRVDRFKLTRKKEIIATLLADPVVVAAVATHAAAQHTSTERARERASTYLKEIVPFFNILAYYRFGYAISKALLGLLYKVTVHTERDDPFAEIPRDATVIYLMNHRSNADYVLVAYALAGQVSVSYAVGEWARAFPLEYLFKSFGGYFIRRKYREELYHTVLRRYVELITQNGVTQGIFPEGGLTRDGTLRPAKIGLLDYALGVTQNAAYRDKLYVVPVGLNYDRVLEDRTLLAEVARQETGAKPARLKQFYSVMRYLTFNTGRLLGGRLKRYGRAAVVLGTPIPVSGWLRSLEERGIDLWSLPKPERLGHVQAFCDQVMAKIGALVPVTPVPLAAAALQSINADFVPKSDLLARMSDMREVLKELNGQVLKAESSIEDVLDRAYKMLRMRRIVSRHGNGYVVLSRGRPLLSYYANSVLHLLGPYADAVRARDISQTPTSGFRW